MTGAEAAGEVLHVVGDSHVRACHGKDLREALQILWVPFESGPRADTRTDDFVMFCRVWAGDGAPTRSQTRSFCIAAGRRLRRIAELVSDTA